MKVLLTGNFPVWLAALVFVLAAGGTVAVYRRQALPRPWNSLLPGLRILVFALLCTCLLQPVLSRFWTHTVRGKIAVIVDDSGSMGIRDTYSPAEAVKTAWQLGLFPRQERCTIFARLQAEGKVFQTELTSLMAGVEKVMLLTGDEAVQPALVDQRLRQQVESLGKLRRQARQMAEALAAIPATFDYLSGKLLSEQSRGSLLYERFDDIAGGALGDLEAAGKFPDSPDAGKLLREFQMPTGAGDRYGAIIRALLYPPVSGEYTFFIIGDDRAALYFSENREGGQARQIASTPAWVKAGETDRYPEQRSAPILLEKGRVYYLEARLKENSGADHCAVGWERPDRRRELPIPGTYFSPVGQTMEHRQFDKEYAAACAAYEEGVRALAEAGESLQQAGTVQNGRRDQAIRRVYQDKLTPLGRMWEQIVVRLAPLQERADEVLAGANIASVDTGLTKVTGMNRYDLACYLLTKGALKISQLKQTGDVELFFMGEPPQPVSMDQLRKKAPGSFRNSTRLGSVAYDVLMAYGNQPVSAVIVLTDGNSNAGRALSETAQVYEELDVPLLGVGFGLVDPPHDIAVDSVTAPASAFKGDQLVLTTVVRRHGYSDRPIRLQVRSGGEVLHVQGLPPGQEDVVLVNLSFVEEQYGYRHYVVEAEPMSGEVLQDNNRRAVSVNILTDPVKALVVDEFPRWETRYVSMMLAEDARVDVQSVFIGNTPPSTGGETAGGLFSREALFGLDVLILGDVPRRALTDEDLANVQAFVTERGGCLILLAGPNHMPRAYRQSLLEVVFPFRVVPEPALGEATADRGEQPLQLNLTESGKQAAPVQLLPSFGDNETIWRQLPAMNWLVEGIHPAPNADVLVTGGDGGQPAVLMAQTGLGRVLFLGTDSFWRWRHRTGSRFHQRLWRQILLWATTGRTTGVDEHVKLMTERAEYSPGETVVLKSRILGADKLPLENGTVAANIVNSEGRTVKRVPFTHLDNSGGEYRAEIRGLPEGKYTAVPNILELEGVPLSADYPFEIRDIPTSEYIELGLNEASLALLTREHVSFPDAGKIPDLIPRLEITESRRSDIEVWDTGWVLILAALILGSEWQLRKRLNLV